MVLEFKDVNLSFGGRRVAGRLSFIAKEGEMVCITGYTGSGNESLLMAILGLSPVDDGYITLDGELLTTDSAQTFRSMMAYVAREMALTMRGKMSDLIKQQFAMKANKGVKFDKSKMMEIWDGIGLDRTLYDKDVKEVDGVSLRIASLTVAMMLKKPVVIVDEPQTDIEIRLLRMIAGYGAVVIVTNKQECRNGIYDKQITLNAE